MSIFNRISAIENKISSIEGRFAGGANPSLGTGSQNYVGGTTPQKSVSFENLIHSLAEEDKFKPGSSQKAGSPQQQLNSESVRPYVAEAAEKYKLDPALVEAVIKQESSYNASARSHCGAEGLMQLMPETAKELGVENSLDPRQNVMGGAKYLRQLMDQFDGNLTKVLAGYNAGPGAVAQFGGVPPYPETQDYVGKVLKNYDEFKS